MGQLNSKSTPQSDEGFPIVWYHDFCQNDLSSSLLHDKTIVVTGCTSGTGLVFARTCIEKGAANVLLLNRPSERATKTERDLQQLAASTAVHSDDTANAVHCNVESIPCDLQSFASVRQAAHAILAKYPAVDVLCNNAAVGCFPEQETSDGYDVQMQTNHLSHFLLTCELFPLLRRAAELRGQARIVHHSSLARKGPALERVYLQRSRQDGGSSSQLGGDGNAAMMKRYQQSKLANALFTAALAKRVSDSKDHVTRGILATCATPGYAATNMQASAPGLKFIYWTRALMAQSAEDGTMPLLAAAFLECPNGSLWNPKHRFGIMGPPILETLEERCSDTDAQEMLWGASEAACGVKFDII